MNVLKQVLMTVRVKHGYVCMGPYVLYGDENLGLIGRIITDMNLVISEQK